MIQIQSDKCPASTLVEENVNCAYYQLIGFPTSDVVVDYHLDVLGRLDNHPGRVVPWTWNLYECMHTHMHQTLQILAPIVVK